LIIIAGTLSVDAADRERYLDAVAEVTSAARRATGCLDFVQAADPIDPARINIYERWESDEDLHRFRNSGGAGSETPPILGGDVHKYRIGAVEEP
jgi:quinol monooxygenase YgiN